MKELLSSFRLNDYLTQTFDHVDLQTQYYLIRGFPTKKTRLKVQLPNSLFNRFKRQDTCRVRIINNHSLISQEIVFPVLSIHSKLDNENALIVELN